MDQKKTEQPEVTKIIIFGTFDLLHAGHENMIAQARDIVKFELSQGTSHITAIIARDETVKKIKGQYPYYRENQRLKNLKNANLVDKVVLGNLHDKYEIIRKTKPDVIALGYDQFAFTHGLEKFLIDEKMNANIQRLKAYKPQIYKSSLIRSTLLERAQQPEQIEEQATQETMLFTTNA